MAVEVDGKTLETTETGFLVNLEDWDENVAKTIADQDGVELTDKHWEVINWLREQYFDNSQHQPNNREILKEMSKRWGKRLSNKDIFDLFPLGPSKQAGRIAGLPESMRKGGY